MIKELNHIGIRSAHMEETISFYQKTLGGQIIRDAASLDGKSRFVYIQIGVGVLELISVGDPANEGFAHVAFLLNGTIDEAYDRLKDQVHFTVLPKVAGSGDGKLAFFEDKSGAIFEIIERKENVRKPAFETPLVKAYNNTTLYTENSRSDCAKFYVEEMGFSEQPDFRFVHGSDALCLMEGATGTARIVFETSDIENAHNAISKELAPGEIKTLEGGRRAFDLMGFSKETIQFFSKS